MKTVSRWVKVVAAAGIFATGCAGSDELGSGDSNGDHRVDALEGALLPDIIVRESDLYDHIEDRESVPGRVEVRLSNGTANIGAGKLHLYGVLPANDDGTQDVMQRVFNAAGEFEDRLAGKFLYHPGHSHIHFVDWAEYRIREILPGDGVGAIIASSQKTSFCILDLGVADAALPNYSPAGEFHSCTSTTQGLSVGWVDIYSKYVSDQAIDITTVAPGDYWLESEVNPLNHVLEANETNNIARIKVTLGGGPLDTYEPNDTRDAVDARPAGGPNSPNLGPVNPHRVVDNLSISSPTDVDWFKFYSNNTGANGDFVRIEFTNAMGDLDLELVDASGNVVGSAKGTGDSEEISLGGRPEGWYYARVFGKNGATNSGYKLTINPPQNAPPSIAVTAPPAGDTSLRYSVDSYTVRWAATDPEGDATWVTVYANTTPTLNGAQKILPPTSLDTPGAQGFYVINSAELTPGSYWIYTEITDGGTTTGAWSTGTVSFIPSPPPNDNCAAATPVGLGNTVFSTNYATTDGPRHALCNQFSNDQIGQDIWFRYHAACAGPVTFSTCGTASFDTKIAVYSETSCTNLDARILACVDDTQGCTNTSSVTVNTTTGQDFLIRVGGYSLTQGNGTLQITAPNAACGPVCGNGIVEAAEECDGSAPDNQMCNLQCKLEFTELVLNEVYYNSPGADVGSFIEIAGPPNLSLTGYRVRFYKGTNGAEYSSPGVDLTGRSIGASGYFLIVQDTNVPIPPGTNSMVSSKANMQNGPDSVQLRLGNTVIDALAYGNFGAGNVPKGEGLPAVDTGGLVKSLARIPNGVDTDNNSLDFKLATPTPGAKN